MSEKFYSREEVLEALRIMSEGPGGRDDGLVSESEVGQLAREMGVDSDRLRQILAGGTGVVQSREVVSKGWGWPGNEEFERTLSGEISGAALDEVADAAGARYEDVGTPGIRETREFWDGWRYVTVDVISREGRTRILGRSRVSWSRLSPFIPFVLIGIMFAVGLTAKSSPENLNATISAILQLAIIGYLWIGYQMRRSRDAIRERIERLAEMAQKRIRENVDLTPEPVSTVTHGDIEQRIRE